MKAPGAEHPRQSVFCRILIPDVGRTALATGPFPNVRRNATLPISFAVSSNPACRRSGSTRLAAFSRAYPARRSSDRDFSWLKAQAQMRLWLSRTRASSPVVRRGIRWTNTARGSDMTDRVNENLTNATRKSFTSSRL